VPRPTTSPELPAAPDAAAELQRWLAQLGGERRMSENTVEAYERESGDDGGGP